MPYNTQCTTLHTITYIGFVLFPVRSPLLRELFLFFGVLRCFSSPTCLLFRGPTYHGRGLPHSEISGSACKRLPGAYRSVTTSFVGPVCLGIHHLPLFACTNSQPTPSIHSSLRRGTLGSRALSLHQTFNFIRSAKFMSTHITHF